MRQIQLPVCSIFYYMKLILYYSVLSCIILYYSVLICIILYSSVRFLYYSVFSCITLYYRPQHDRPHPPLTHDSPWVRRYIHTIPLALGTHMNVNHTWTKAIMWASIAALFRGLHQCFSFFVLSSKRHHDGSSSETEVLR